MAEKKEHKIVSAGSGEVTKPAVKPHLIIGVGV